jgi:hypothetical protein
MHRPRAVAVLVAEVNNDEAGKMTDIVGIALAFAVFASYAWPTVFRSRSLSTVPTALKTVHCALIFYVWLFYWGYLYRAWLIVQHPVRWVEALSGVPRVYPLCVDILTQLTQCVVAVPAFVLCSYLLAANDKARRAVTWLLLLTLLCCWYDIIRTSVAQHGNWHGGTILLACTMSSVPIVTFWVFYRNEWVVKTLFGASSKARRGHVK